MAAAMVAMLQDKGRRCLERPRSQRASRPCIAGSTATTANTGNRGSTESTPIMVITPIDGTSRARANARRSELTGIAVITAINPIAGMLATPVYYL